MKVLENYDLVLGFISVIIFSVYILHSNFLFSPVLAIFFSATVSLYCLTIYNQRNMLRKMKKENEQKDCYVASVIHDLKNPLLGQSRILEKLIRENNMCDIYKQMLITNKLLFEMVISVTNTYKYANGKISLNCEEINLKNIILDVCKELTYLTEEERFININFSGDNTDIIADAVHIRRVISNLISNAIKYRKENTTVNLNLIAKKSFCIFSVTNEGYHIPENQQEQLFEKYVTKSSRFNSTSCGLGLYLSKNIVENHGGKMFVNSESDGINTFGFTIPQCFKLTIKKKIRMKDRELKALKNFT